SDKEFDPKSIVSDSFTGFDLADSGIDKGVEILANKYKIGKIQKALEVIAPSLFDITIEDGVQIVGLNKESSTIITDLVGNILIEGIETKLENNKIEIPTIKLSASKEAEIIGEYIIQKIEGTMEEMGNNNYKRNSSNQDERN